MKHESILVLFTAAVLCAGCSPTHDEAYLPPPADPASPQPTFEEMGVADARDASDAALSHQKEAAIATVERSIMEIDARLDNVVSSIEQLDEGIQTEVQPVLEHLRDQREQLDALVDQMRTVSGDAWQDLQRDFQAAYRSLLNHLEETEELLRG